MSYASRQYAGDVACWASTSAGILMAALTTAIWACKKYVPPEMLASAYSRTIGRPWLPDDGVAGVLIWAALLYAMLSSKATRDKTLAFRIAWTYVDALMLLALLLVVLWVFRLATMFGGDGSVSFNPAKDWLVLPARAPLSAWVGMAVTAAAIVTLLALVASAFFRRVRPRGNTSAAKDAALMYPLHSIVLLGTPGAVAAVRWAIVNWPHIRAWLSRI